MRIIGIDPGLKNTGYGIIDVERGVEKLVDYGCIETSSSEPFEERLANIYKTLAELMERYHPSDLAIEELFFSKNTKTALAVSHARGVVLLCARHQRQKIHEYTPLEIKQALVGYGVADKSQVQMMVKILLRLSEVPEPDHASDALAAAICCAHDSSPC